MAVVQAPQQLEQEQLGVPGAQPTRVSFHVLTQISVLKQFHWCLDHILEPRQIFPDLNSFHIGAFRALSAW